MHVLPAFESTQVSKTFDFTGFVNNGSFTSSQRYWIEMYSRKLRFGRTVGTTAWEKGLGTGGVNYWHF